MSLDIGRVNCKEYKSRTWETVSGMTCLTREGSLARVGRLLGESGQC